jgi:hypothetical protein
VPDEIVKLSKRVDEKVIDSCLELLAVGRPLSVSEARRLAAVSPEHPASLPLKTVEKNRPGGTPRGCRPGDLVVKWRTTGHAD